jgi:hypothetical protein
MLEDQSLDIEFTYRNIKICRLPEAERGERIVFAFRNAK